MSYIHAYSTISRMSSNTRSLMEGWLKASEFNEVLEPDYKTVLNPRAVRRMSKIIKMGVYTAIEAMGEAHISGIVHATGLGCLADTQRFLDVIDAAGEEGILSPTSFIQSTHNTIAGQIALIKQIQAYNMTHVQNGVSFEAAMVDALCLVGESQGNVFLGAADEHAPILDDLMQHYQIDPKHFSYGASSFLLGPEQGALPLQINHCEIGQIEANPVLPEVDLLLSGKSFFKASSAGINGIDYSELTGVYNTNSAAALQLACEILLADEQDLKQVGITSRPQTVGVYNNFLDTHFGTVIVERI